jgi:hypothetical protein
MNSRILSEFIKNYKEESLMEQLEHLKFEKTPHECIVTLVDSNGIEVVKGYGKIAIEALNDLHSALL